FVCSPHPMQWAGVEAWNYDVSRFVDEYRDKRDLMRSELQSHFDIQGAQGAFYMFLPAPWGTATEFVKAAIDENLLIIPGNVFSPRDTHFRISYAASNDTLKRGAEVLRRLAERGA
ncbi:MAG: aminotransferase class I/II-fold pyridoxal phosphate-dependent enzyme, partial [Planctomycetaceae bacterium]|nr:aminotransferase class I/II-fold pyridoxal phosphate-dependent enzyme [Planctomycetaceae bacterium]